MMTVKLIKNILNKRSYPSNFCHLSQRKALAVVLHLFLHLYEKKRTLANVLTNTLPPKSWSKCWTTEPKYKQDFLLPLSKTTQSLFTDQLLLLILFRVYSNENSIISHVFCMQLHYESNGFQLRPLSLNIRKSKWHRKTVSSCNKPG